MPHVVIRAAVESDAPALLTLADRLPAFGPTTHDAVDIAQRERRALAEALSHPNDSSALLVAELSPLGLIGVIHLDTRRDYFTDQAHGYVAILAVAREAEGQGVGRALLEAAEAWARAKGFTKLTLAVFTENRHAKDVYQRLGWRPELETWYKSLT